MTLTKKTTHVAEAPVLFVAQFKDAANMKAFIEIMADQIQDLEDAQFEVLTEVSDLTVAVGEQLDNLGRIVNEPRNGKTDTDYRIAIAGRINLNLSEGTGEDLIALVLGIVTPNTIEIADSGIAHFDLTIQDPITLEEGILSNIFVQSGKAAGVRGITHWQIDTGVEYFGFLGDPDALGFATGDFATASD